MKYALFALLPIILIGVLPAADAIGEVERGKNFDRKYLGVGPDGRLNFEWSSAPERILDGNQYKDYIIREDSGNIYFEAATISYSFNKNTCTFNMYDGGHITTNEQRMGLSHVIKEAANGTDTWTDAAVNSSQCQYEIISDDSGMRLIAIKDDFKVVYDINYIFGFEWTYEYTNTDSTKTNEKYGFTFVCDGPRCDDIRLDGMPMTDPIKYKGNLTQQYITVNGHPFDSKNYVHDYLWALKKQENKMVVDFTHSKGPLPVGHTLIVDPTFGPASSGTVQRVITTGAGGVACPGAPYTKSAANNFYKISSPDAAGDCGRVFFQFDVTTISDDLTAVSSMNFTTTYSGQSNMGSQSCDLKRIYDDPSSAAAALLWAQSSATPTIESGNTQCRTASTNTIQMGTTAKDNLLAAILAGNNTYGMAMKLTDETRDALSHSVTISTPTLKVVYSSGPPDAVTTLATSATTTSSTRLSWSAPDLQGGTLQRYVINYTTPCGIPTTHLANGTTATTYDVTGLTAATCYSFMVSAATQKGYNFSGNIANATTLAFNEANFTIGSFNYDADNPLRLPIRYERIDSGANTYVNITFSQGLTLGCDLQYTYAQQNRTYTSIPSSAISSTERRSQFLLTNSTNDIITFHCYDQGGNASANYVVVQEDFLLLQQIRDFRSGEFGTMGQLGAFDLVALIVIIISMIGLNRNNEAVGGIFAIIAISVIAYFEIVSWVTAIVAAAAVIIMMVVSSVKKD